MVTSAPVKCTFAAGRATMEGMDSKIPPDDWWPEWLQDVGKDDPLATDPVVVATVEETKDAYEHYRQLFTALVPVEQLDSILEQPGGVGFEVSSSGPHPVDSS